MTLGSYTRDSRFEYFLFTKSFYKFCKICILLRNYEKLEELVGFSEISSSYSLVETPSVQYDFEQIYSLE